MNNPLSFPSGNFKLLSLRNKLEDEKSIIDLRGENNIFSKNSCPFPSRVYVINREDRPDRWESFCSNNQEIFERFEVIRWGATTTGHQIPEVVDAIFDSFLKCIEYSSKQDETFIVMEDDAYLAEGGIEKLKKSWEDLPLDWDVLIGNHYLFYQIEVLTDHLAKPVGRASTANFLVLRNTILPKITENQGIRRGNPSIRDFDHFITSEMVPINNYTVWPMISREIPSYSDHQGKIFDSSFKIRENSFKYLFVDQEKYYSSLE